MLSQKQATDIVDSGNGDGDHSDQSHLLNTRRPGFSRSSDLFRFFYPLIRMSRIPRFAFFGGSDTGVDGAGGTIGVGSSVVS